MIHPIRHFQQSLSSKLGLGYLLMAVPIFVVSLGILFLQSRYIIRKEAKAYAMSVLNTDVQRVRSFMSTIETATNSNEWMALEDLQPDSLLQLSRRIVLLNRNVNGCSITTEPYFFPQYGRYFSAYSIMDGDSVTTVREGEYEYFDKVWYKTPKTLGKACWVEPFDDYNEGTLYTTELIVSYCKPLYKEVKDRKEFIGVISTDLSLRSLDKVILSSKPYPHAYYMLIGPDGHYFVHPDSTRLFKQTIFTDADPRRQPDIITLGHQMTEGHEGAMKVVVDGVACLVCYQRVPGTQWSLALVCPESDILQSYRLLVYIIIAISIIGLVLIVLLCRRLVNRAIHPIQGLLVRLRQIASGNYNQQIARSERIDAVGKLQNSFSLMQQSLEHHIGAIQQATKDIQLSNEQLSEATQLADEAARQKTIFIQNMTHQVRTPLNIIMGFAQVLRDSMGMLSDEEVRSIGDIMDHNAASLNRMILMLFDSSEVGRSEELAIKSEIEDFVCNHLAKECIRFTNMHFPQLHIRFESTLPDSCTLRTNHLYFMRSLRELLYNAAKYSDGQHVAIILSQTDNTILFTVQDTGAGIPTDYRDLMFTPFTKVNDLSEGLGLGLPLSMRHILNLGGKLYLDDSYQEGCRIIIEMPK